MAYSYTGRRLIADILEDITGLTEWVDYFPVQYDETTDTATKEGALIITDEGGTGDNHPVFLVTGRTHPFRCSATGYVPIIDAPVTADTPPVFLETLSTYDGVASVFSLNQTVKLPAVETGDLLVLIAAFGTSQSINTPTGWNRFRCTKPWRVVTNNPNNVTILWKIADADSAATTQLVTFTGSVRAEFVAIRIAKNTFHPYNPLDMAPEEVITTTGTVSTAASITPPTVSPSWGSNETLWIPFAVFQKAQAGANLVVAEVADEVSYASSTTSVSVYGVGLHSLVQDTASFLPYDFLAYDGASPSTLSMFSDVLAIRPYPAIAPVAPDSELTLNVTPTVTTTTAAASIVNYPASTTSGDILVCVFTSIFNKTITIPVGWTQVGTEARYNDVSQYIFYKTADGTEGGTTFTVTQSGNAARVAIVIKLDPTVVDATGSFIEKPTNTEDTTKIVPCPTATPSWGTGSKTLFIPIMSMYRLSQETRAFPYYNNPVTYQSAGGGNTQAPGISVDSRSATVASESPGDFQLVDDGLAARDWVADTLMIKLVV
jgi:hypothetical protein